MSEVKEVNEVRYLKNSNRLAMIVFNYNCNSIYHYIIEPNVTKFSSLRFSCDKKNINMINEICYFETCFVEYIIATNMEEYGIKLILKAFSQSYRYIIDDDGYYLNFIPMFRSGARKHPCGKIPFQLLIDAICCRPPGLYEGNMFKWAKENEECYMMIRPIAILYANCSYFFDYPDGSNLARVIVDYKMF
uniref:Uncharacterized protein n=1 Tax=Pithovirus LCPAC406 TaxID=2506599 RepID=A0A481ZFM2_9VIRU|nr:MAG: hypothetical protein LCPAC406_00640 [Pithovirus LCPAC406]